MIQIAAFIIDLRPRYLDSNFATGIATGLLKTTGEYQVQSGTRTSQ
ncbi:MAG: hypothetical protein WA781_09915 [Pseudolabrys sp.]|jgi:hypothetical protein